MARAHPQARRRSSPRRLLAFIIIFVGVLSSVATDAGYLILDPARRRRVPERRAPSARRAWRLPSPASAPIFAVNIAHRADRRACSPRSPTRRSRSSTGDAASTIIANFYFCDRLVDRRSRSWPRSSPSGSSSRASARTTPDGDRTHPSEDDARRPTMRAAAERAACASRSFGLLGHASRWSLLLTVPPGAPLRDPETGDIIGNTPFMDSLIFIITMIFLVCRHRLRHRRRDDQEQRRRHRRGHEDVRRPGRAGLHAADDQPVHRLLQLQQHADACIAVELADLLERADIGALPLLIGMILVICCSTSSCPGSCRSGRSSRPIFVPLFIRLGVAPQTVLAAYRVGDSPMNVITPLMVYLPFIVIVAQRYKKDAGIGTIISLMLPYTMICWSCLDCCSSSSGTCSASRWGRATRSAGKRRPATRASEAARSPRPSRSRAGARHPPR